MAVALMAMASWSARADDFFATKVEPLLKKRCFECHSHEGKIKGGLALDSKSGWVKGGETGPAIVPGDLEKSPLISAVRYGNKDLEMPPKEKLAADELAVLERWVAMGAPDPRAETTSAVKKGVDIEAGRKHWAYQPVRQPSIPAVKDRTWARADVDAFVLSKLEAAGLSPNPDADAYTWLRRVSLDLTGLPPAPEDIKRFISDASAQAAERVVDRLLESKAFGERWARYWLDLVGYAEQIGTEGKIFAEHAWRYRDYVIDAFNHDKPYDQFIREQIAGDLLPATTPKQRRDNIIATGFLVLGDVDINSIDKLKMEIDLVDQQVSKVGIAFMGMTMGCVRCHDHKFDAVSQTDYYAMAGMFRSTRSTFKTEFGIWSNVFRRELPETAGEKAARQVKLGAEKARINVWRAERDGLAEEQKKVDAALKTAEGEAKAALQKQRTDLAARLGKLETRIGHGEYFAPNAPQALAVEDVAKPADMRITIRGNPYALGETVKRGVLRVASWSPQPVIPPDQSGRLQLADWLANARNPLTARLAVNRIWQRLFGEGIVRSVDYFGVRGEKPTHPELLDDLAARFMRNGWSQKQLIRELVLSRSYRMGSASNPAAMNKDPENRLLWRMNRQRLDAESIRDAMLAASGTLTSAASGPAMALEYPENVSGFPLGKAHPAFSLTKERPSHDYERTIYLPVVRTGTQPGSARLRDVFDFPQPAQITGMRAETAVPTQSLFLLNSDMLRARGAEVAKAITATAPDANERIGRLWLQVLSRPVTREEREDALAFLATFNPANNPGGELNAWTELARSLLGCNEFLLRL